MRQIKDQILKLHAEGLNYDQIAKELNCSKGAISYHLGKGQKEKSKNRLKKTRLKQHPFLTKIQTFLIKQKSNNTKNDNLNYKKCIYDKVFFFKKRNNLPMESNFTIEDVINKIGENPVCYLTGKKIDIYDTKSYQFDHIIPSSRGGSNDLDNLGITTKEANFAKRDMTPEEFIVLCKDVLTNFGYKVSK